MPIHAKKLQEFSLWRLTEKWENTAKTLIINDDGEVFAIFFYDN